MNAEARRYLGGRTAEVSEPESEAFHVSAMQRAMILVALTQAPLYARIQALSLILGAYTDRGVA